MQNRKSGKDKKEKELKWFQWNRKVEKNFDGIEKLNIVKEGEQSGGKK